MKYILLYAESDDIVWTEGVCMSVCVCVCTCVDNESVCYIGVCLDRGSVHECVCVCTCVDNKSVCYIGVFGQSKCV